MMSSEETKSNTIGTYITKLNKTVTQNKHFKKLKPSLVTMYKI